MVNHYKNKLTIAFKVETFEVFELFKVLNFVETYIIIKLLGMFPNIEARKFSTKLNTKTIQKLTLVVKEKLLIELRCTIVKFPLLLKKVLQVFLAQDSARGSIIGISLH